MTVNEILVRLLLTFVSTLAIALWADHSKPPPPECLKELIAFVGVMSAVGIICCGLAFIWTVHW
jgi:hypothetical protein